MDSNADVGRRYLFLENDGDELVIEVGDGPAVHREAFADGILLERDSRDEPLRIRITGLTARRWTNSMITPVVRCSGEPAMSARERLYWWCIREQGTWTRMFWS